MIVKEAQTVNKGLVKQDCVIADATGSCTVILWEDNVDLLVKGMSYELSGMVVRNYMGKKYLSIPKDDFDVNLIDDIGEVDEEIVEEEKEMKGAVVVGVKYFESYDACYSCKGKVVATGSVGECGQCGIMQKIEKCSTSTTAKIDVEVDGHYTVFTYRGRCVWL